MKELDIKGVAAHFGVHPITVRRWIAAGLLPAHRVGRKLVRVYEKDLARLNTAIGASV